MMQKLDDSRKMQGAEKMPHGGLHTVLENIDAAADYLRSEGIVKPEVGLILGSGLGGYVDTLKEKKDTIVVEYSKIPGFMETTVAGHEGEMVYSKVEGKQILVMAGRFHLYEGYSIEQIVFPLRVMIRLGIKRLIITNAAGAINESFKVGSLMLIKDHINQLGSNPLVGPNIPEFGPRFPDMTNVYSKELREKLTAMAAAEGIKLEQGVYVSTKGPSFETPAEIKFFRVIGADAVGMSSVPEAIVAAHAGLEIIGISCLSNMAAGILDQPLSGAEVDEVGKRIAQTFGKVVDMAIKVEMNL